MRSDWLVEEGPWEIAEQEIRRGKTGRVVEVCVGEIIGDPAGQESSTGLRKCVEQWKSRLESLFGSPRDESTLSAPLAVSVLLRYHEGPIVRLFADTAGMGSGPGVDFEVIGTAQSLIHRSTGGLLAGFHARNPDGRYSGRLIRRADMVADLQKLPRHTPVIRLGVISLEHPHSTGNHLPALRHLQHAVQVAAIADRDPARSKSLLKEYGAKYYSSRDDLLADENIDAVLITSRNCDHAADAIAAAEAGKDILCDKPIATTLADTLAIVDACRRTGVRFVTTYPCRFNASIRELKRSIADGDFGEIQAIMATNHGCMYEPGAPEWVKDPQCNGGGCIIDHTVHVADLMRYVTGQEFTEARTFAGSMLRGIAAEDIAVTHGKMSGDIVYQIDCSWSRRPCDPPWGDVTMRVVGTKGAAGLDLYNDYRVEIFTPAGIEFRYPNALCYEHARVFLDYQMEKVAGIRGANADEIDGLRTMELVFASYESAAKKSTITIHQHKP